MPPLTITAHCRALTPMLAGGADQTKFELRASEVKSALRFWWRAFHDFPKAVEMFEAESHLFGGKIQVRNPEGKLVEQAVAAPFRLDISATSVIDFFNPGQGQETQRQRDGSRKKVDVLGDDVTEAWGDGVRYIFYAILHHTGKVQNIAAKTKGRQVAKPGFTFDLRFTFRRPDQGLVAEVLRSLWLLMNLGGIGARSRRGAGCFTITGFTPALTDLTLTDVPNFSQEGFQTPAAYLRAGLEVILQAWYPQPVPTYTAEPPYTAFRPGISEIHVLDNPTVGMGQGALQAMDAVGYMMKKYRHINPWTEAKKMHAALHTGTIPTTLTELTKAQFGLPIIYNFRGPKDFGKPGKPAIFGGYTAQGIKVTPGSTPDFAKAAEDKTNADRRSSPLLISCHEWTDGRGYAVVCHLPAPLLPDGQKIWLKANKKDYPSTEHHVCEPPSNYNLVNKLIQGSDNSLAKGFSSLTSLWSRTGTTRTSTTSSAPDSSGPPPSSSLPADPQARKLFFLQQVGARDDGLTWHLGEISGPPQGSGKKQAWPCRLWRLAGEELQEVAGDWRIRAKEVPLGEQPRLCVGTFFLCTTQADAKTPNPSNFLYNFQRLT